MIDYQRMYGILFHGITNAIFNIGNKNYAVARAILIKAQRAAEEIYMRAGE